jgi:hypothetical protein
MRMGPNFFLVLSFRGRHDLPINLLAGGEGSPFFFERETCV